MINYLNCWSNITALTIAKQRGKGALTGVRNHARERLNKGLVQLYFSLIPSFCRSTVSLENRKKIENYLRS